MKRWRIEYDLQQQQVEAELIEKEEPIDPQALATKNQNALVLDNFKTPYKKLPIRHPLSPYLTI